MANMMEFPASVEEFMEQYKMTDTEHVYSNGTEYVPIYRMKQWFEHVNPCDFQPGRHGRWERTSDGAARCTACKRKMNPSQYGYAFCSLCGAMMDGGAD